MPPAAPTAPGRGRQRSAPPPPRTCELARGGMAGPGAADTPEPTPNLGPGPAAHRDSAPPIPILRELCMRGRGGKKKDNTLYSSNGQKSPSASVTCSEEEAGERGSGGDPAAASPPQARRSSGLRTGRTRAELQPSREKPLSCLQLPSCSQMGI